MFPFKTQKHTQNHLRIAKLKLKLTDNLAMCYTNAFSVYIFI